MWDETGAGRQGNPDVVFVGQRQRVKSRLGHANDSVGDSIQAYYLASTEGEPPKALCQNS